MMGDRLITYTQKFALMGCKPSNHPSLSRAAEAAPPLHGIKGILGRLRLPKPRHCVR